MYVLKFAWINEDLFEATSCIQKLEQTIETKTKVYNTNSLLSSHD